MSEFTKTESKVNRRSALKLGALAAAPVAALAPVTALAGDDNAVRLARMEDERAIADLVKQFVRHFNGNGDCSTFIANAGAVRIDPQVSAIREDAGRDPQLTIAEDGRSASWKAHADIEFVTYFEGDTTVEKMARFQGQGSAASRASRRLEARLTRTNDGWTISQVTLA